MSYRGGQAQRVAIARALINNPQILIADEPTGNLDSISSRLVMELLSDIHQTGSTILMVTHNPELTRFANRVVFMHDGDVVGDEKSAIGTVPRAIQKKMYFIPQKTIEDELAGVSAMMNAFPQAEAKPNAKTKSKRKSKAKSQKSKGRR